MDKIKDLNPMYYATDLWKVYQKIVPKTKHLISKKETTQVESYNSNVRHYLARFKRKTKCYSKSENLLKLSIYLLIYKNLIPYIL